MNESNHSPAIRHQRSSKVALVVGVALLAPALLLGAGPAAAQAQLARQLTVKVRPGMNAQFEEAVRALRDVSRKEGTKNYWLVSQTMSGEPLYIFNRIDELGLLSSAAGVEPRSGAGHDERATRGHWRVLLLDQPGHAGAVPGRCPQEPRSEHGRSAEVVFSDVAAGSRRHRASHSGLLLLLGRARLAGAGRAAAGNAALRRARRRTNQRVDGQSHPRVRHGAGSHAAGPELPAGPIEAFRSCAADRSRSCALQRVPSLRCNVSAETVRPVLLVRAGRRGARKGHSMTLPLASSASLRNVKPIFATENPARAVGTLRYDRAHLWGREK
jgi:hypothetical protein